MFKGEKGLEGAKQCRFENIKDIKEKLQRHKQEKLECKDKVVLKLGVRCHAGAPRYLIFYCLILALWILSDCPLKTFLMHTPNYGRKVLITELLYSS